MHIVQIRINQLLQEHDETQKWLAQRAGVTEASISRIVKGQSVPGADVLGKIADAFDVSADYLLGRTTDRRVPGKKDELQFIVGRTYQRCTTHDQMIILAVLAEYLSQDDSKALAADMESRRGEWRKQLR